MGVNIFDTHQAVTALINSGMPEKQAEAVINTLKEAQAHSASSLATKDDLRELELRVIKWVIGVALVQVVLLLSILLK